MATKSLGMLTLDMIARIGGFTGPMDQAARHVQKRMKDIEREAKRLGTAIGVAGVAMAVLVRQSINAADQARKTAQAVGLTTEAFTGLQFASKLAGVESEGLSSALSRLNATIGEAAIGSKNQSALFRAMGISIRDASGDLRSADKILLDVAERFQAMPDGAEKSATAIHLFGRAGAAMIPLLISGRDGIEQLTAKAEALGLVVSDKTAASAEQFNDSLEVLRSTLSGVGNQLAAGLLPVLNTFTGILMDMTEEGFAASGVGEVLAGVLRGLGSAAVIAASGLHLTAKAIAGLVSIQAAALEGKRWWENLVPVLAARRVVKNWGAVKRQMDIVGKDMDQTADDWKKIWDKIWDPAAGTDLAARIKEAKGLLDAFREERDGAGGGSSAEARAAERLAEQLERQVEAVEMQAKTWGMTAVEAKLYQLQQEGATQAQIDRARAALEQVEALEALERNRQRGLEAQRRADEAAQRAYRQAQDDYAALNRELRTDEEKLTDQLRERLAVLEAISGLSAEERDKNLGRIAAAGFKDAPKYSGLAPEVGGALGEALKLNAAQSELDAWYKAQLDLLAKYREERSEMNAQWDAQELELTRKHAEEKAKIEQAQQILQIESAQAIFGSVLDITRNFAGESSGIYRAMFAVQKAAAIAQSIVAIQTGLAQAAAQPFPANLAAMASVSAATSSIISNIMAVGMAHDGIDSVPQDGTWLLQKGEKVVAKDTSAKLDATLDRLNQSRVAVPHAAASAQNIRIVNAFESAVVGDYLGSDAGERKIMNVVRRNQATIRQMAGAR